MKKVLIVEDCRYAQSKPHLPILEFVKGETPIVEDYLADSIIENGYGLSADNEPELTVEPELKEKPQKYRGKKRNRS